MQRSAPRPARLLACAAAATISAALVTGCSSASSSSSAKTTTGGSASSSASGSASPSLAAAKYRALPEPCRTISAKTVKSLVPKVKNASGDAAKSSDPASRGGCSWNGLNGYQYRWLDVALQRFDSVAGIGTAQGQAQKRYTEQVTETKAVKGAKAEPVTGVGDAATVVTAEVKKDKEQYEDVTVVARTGNVVVILSFNGAGFETAKTPKASALRTDALKAAKEAVASVAAKNA
ncbi:MAG: hypothetical protein QOF44_1811 [Streptomyces sp.]|nr:hypothetical protein [Streptomyces sp.]